MPLRGPLTARHRRGFMLALVALAAVVLTSCGGGKSYSFPEVRIDATVNQDGSISVEEHRTFDFHGDFSFAFFTVEHKQYSDVVDFTVSEGDDVYEVGPGEVPGTVLLEDNTLEGPGGFKYKATWWFDAHDEQRTWTIRYRVLCAADVYADTAHLLWEFIGQGWSVPTDLAVITIHLPGRAEDPPERPQEACYPPGIVSEGVPPVPSLPTEPLREGEIQAWGHGPDGPGLLEAETTIVDPQTVRLEIHNLQPGVLAEGSVLFPV